MTENAPTFRTTMRGYDPAAVDYRIAELTAALNDAHQHSTELADRVRQLTALAEDAHLQAEQEPRPVTFADFGERVGEILILAEEEATEIRSTAAAEVDRKLAEIESSTVKLRVDADRYASEVRAAAEREAGRIVEESKRTADQLLDDADRQATARGEEAEALYEHQRAQAAKAAADFEQTLAGRRDKAERVFQERTALAEQQLAMAEEQVAQLRAETEQSTNEAARKAERLTNESKATAEQIVAEAIARADRIRSESERELLAATQRRDSINAQLANVRHMLATLSGAAVGGKVELEDPPYITDEASPTADASDETAVNGSAAEQAEDEHKVANESRQR
jgi:cell division septum initiation protein DivIVA